MPCMLHVGKLTGKLTGKEGCTDQDFLGQPSIIQKNVVCLLYYHQQFFFF